MARGDERFTHLAHPGQVIALSVKPRAARSAIALEGEMVKVAVTEAPDRGRATRAALKALARALGIAPSRLELISGATAREKRVRVRAPGE